MRRLSRSGRLLTLLGLAAWAGCGHKPAANKAAEQRLEELKTNIMTQMDRNKDFHIRNKDKLDWAGTGSISPASTPPFAPPSPNTPQPSVSPATQTTSTRGR